MAKYKQSAQDIIHNIVLWGYELGVWHSTIVHTILLLLLSMIVLVEPKPKVIPIHIVFDDPIEIDMSSSISVDMGMVLQETLGTTASSSAPPSAIDAHNEPDIVIDALNIDSEIETKQETASVSLPQTTQTIVKRRRNNTQPKSSPKPPTNTNKLSDMLTAGASFGQNANGNQHKSSNESNSRGNIEEKLSFYGAKTGDIQISISWDTVDDIDLHVQYASQIGNTTIYWANRFAVGGILDIDMNGKEPNNASPIENIFWPKGSSPNGKYVVGVHFFRPWTNNTNVPVTVRIQTPEKGVQHHQINIRPRQMIFVDTFMR